MTSDPRPVPGTSLSNRDGEHPDVRLRTHRLGLPLSARTPNFRSALAQEDDSGRARALLDEQAEQESG